MNSPINTCICEACESPDKHNIYADDYCQECYEECREESYLSQGERDQNKLIL